MNERQGVKALHRPRARTRLAGLSGSILLGAALAASAGAPAVAADQTVTVKNLTFTPDEITVRVGETVTWVSQETGADDIHLIHEVNHIPPWSEFLDVGGTARYTFDETSLGRQQISCLIHVGSMFMTVNVLAATPRPATPPPATPPPATPPPATAPPATATPTAGAETPEPTETVEPTDTPEPTETVEPTDTPEPTETVAAETDTPSPDPADSGGTVGDSGPGGALILAVLALVAAGAIGGGLAFRRMRATQGT